MSNDISDIAQIARPTRRPEEKWVPDSWQLGDEGDSLSEQQRRVARQWNRIIRWAMKKPKAYLAHYIARLIFKSHADRIKLRKVSQHRTEVRDLAGQILHAHKASVAKNRGDRSSGGYGKIKKNAVAKAKAEAKSEALSLWLERHAGKHPKLRTVADFATEVMKRWPVLTSSDVIERWSARWTKAIKAGKTPLP